MITTRFQVRLFLLVVSRPAFQDLSLFQRFAVAPHAALSFMIWSEKETIALHPHHRAG